MPKTTKHIRKRFRFDRSWGGRTFRFNLKNFIPGSGFSLRRFSIVEAAVLLMIALVASRLLGVARQSLFGALFGTGFEANAYYAAAKLPDSLFDLIAGGALSHAFIPIFLSYEKNEGQRKTWELTSLVFNVLLVALTVLVIGAEFLAPAFVSHILVPGFPPAQQDLTTQLTRIMLIQPLVLGLGTIATAILNSKRQFLLPAISVAMHNIGLILGLLASHMIPGIGIYGPTYGMLLAAAAQVAVQIPGLFKLGVRYSFNWNLREPGLVSVVWLLLPNALAVFVAYAGSIIDTNFVSRFPDTSVYAALHNAQMFEGLPYALVSQAVGQALLPHLALHAAAGRFFRMRQTALKVMSVSILLTIPAALALAFVGKPLISLLLQHGKFSAHDTNLTNLALIGYLAALPFITGADLLSRSYYALKDATTPLLTNILSIAVRVVVILLLLQLLHGQSMVLIIPLAIGAAEAVEMVLLFLIMFFRLQSKIKEEDAGLQRLRRRKLRAQTASAEAMQH